MNNWGRIANDYNQILKLQLKSNGLNDLCIITAITNAAKYT
jgi:hypothetical protein